ncbi:MAG: sigma-70 family RNA polymerase sigma factor [Verrucomicrobia bacterium]|nr:sigma-70 family RNA polymerase sigma factor [Verrucomicrobiota bacterium]
MSPPVTPSDERSQADAQLIRRMAARDQAALATFYDRFATPLFSTAVRIIGDRAEAEDLMHDVFVALWDKAADFDDQRGSAYAWAITLVRSRAIARVRSRRRRGEPPATSAPTDLRHGESPVAARDSADDGDHGEAVRAAVATLPPDQKRALELAFFGSLTPPEIAAQFAEPLGTVQARIHRGLLSLRDALPSRP